MGIELSVVAALGLCGCGITGESNPNIPNASDNPASATGQQVIIPVAGGATISGTDDRGTAIGGFFNDATQTQPIIGPDQIDNFLSFLTDALVLSTFDGPTPPTSYQPSETYLERICIDNGTPEHVCRQQYGP